MKIPDSVNLNYLISLPDDDKAFGAGPTLWVAKYTLYSS